MNFRKSFFLLLLLNLYTTTALKSFALNDNEDQEFDEFTFELPEGTVQQPHNRGIIPIFAQFALQNTPDIPTPEKILLTPLYRRTNPIRRRSILDNEIFQNDFHASSSSFTVTPFFNFTYKGCFNGNDTTIKNYLDLLQGDVPEEIEALVVQLMGTNNPDIDDETVETFSSLDIPDILELFGNIKAQEKQLGGMMRYIYDSHNGWKVDVRIPLIWQIYNFFLTQEEQDFISQQPIMKLIGEVADFMPFAKAHLISDKIGIGDTQIRYEIAMTEKLTSSSSIGFSLGIPTAWAFKKGAYGSYFNKKASAPDFELVRDIVQLLENNVDDITDVKKNGGDLGLAALDRLSSVILDHPLGRDNHWTLGIYYKSTLDFTPTIQLRTTAHVICPLPGNENRFIKTRITQKEISAMQALPLTTEEDATFALNTYNKYLLRKLFPQSYSCSIFPGIILMSNSCLTYTYGKWTFAIGSDMWAQTREHLLSIHVDYDKKKTLDSSTIINEYAYQAKTYISIHYHNPESSWMYTFMAGATGIGDRIGDSTTFAFNIQRDF